MIKKFEGLNFKSNNFIDGLDLKIFEGSSNFCAIYGRNGCGKTTISKLFEFINKGDLNEESLNKEYNFTINDIYTSDNFEFDDKQEEKIENFKKNLLNNICVFNESFIEKNIKFLEFGLDTVVIFDEEQEIDSKINALKIQLKSFEEKYKNEQNKLDEKKENKNNLEKSIVDYFKNTWAELEKEINEKQRRPSHPVYTLEIAKNLEKIESINLDDLKLEFKNKKFIFDNIKKSKKQKIRFYLNDTSLSTIPDNIDEKIINLINKEVKKIELSERETKIIEIFTSNISTIEKSKNYFKNSKYSFCPYCHQDVTKEQKESIIKSVDKILNKEVQSIQHELKNFDFLEEIDIKKEIINIDLDTIDENIIDSNLKNDILEKQIKYNSVIKYYKEKLNDKEEKIFDNISIENKNLEKCKEEIIELLNSLKNKILKYNEQVDEFEKSKEELLKLNENIAILENKDNYINLKQVNEEISSIEKESLNLSDNIKKFTEDIKELESKKENIHIPVDLINKNLSYIFFDKDYLKLEVDDYFGKEIKTKIYKILSKNKNVAPKNISIGERNALALVYFFIKSNENVKKSEIYTNDKLYVIDDPVSSFDYSNKVGIMTYLKKELSSILNNSNNKILILSHDLNTILNINDIIYHKKNKIILKEIVFENNLYSIKKLETKKYNEYLSLIENVFIYIESQENINNIIDKNENYINLLSISIGNICRRWLESFCTYNYCEGMDYLKNIITDKNEYFENSIYRLILNSESHQEGKVKRLEPITPSFTKEEKLKICKDVVCLIYIINKLHIEKCLEKINNNQSKERIEKIKTWIDEIN